MMVYNPSKEEIREACAKIQSKWKPATERLRRVGKGAIVHWTPQVVSTADMPEEIMAMLDSIDGSNEEMK